MTDLFNGLGIFAVVLFAWLIGIWQGIGAERRRHQEPPPFP
jgi:hypothetical protein